LPRRAAHGSIDLVEPFDASRSRKENPRVTHTFKLTITLQDSVLKITLEPW
jgi:hypothetical protein